MEPNIIVPMSGKGEFSFYRFINTLDGTQITDELHHMDKEMMEFYEEEYRFMVCTYGWIENLRHVSRHRYVWEPADQYLATSMFCSH